MRLKMFLLPIASTLLVCPRLAQADTLDDFTITGNGVDITFTLPATNLAVIQPFDSHSYWRTSFPEVVNGVPQTGSLALPLNYGDCSPAEPSLLAGIGICGLYSPPFSGGPSLWTLGTFTPNVGFSGGTWVVTFNPGTYQDTDMLHPIGACPALSFPYLCTYPRYTITVTPESQATSTAATPEPGGLALLSTGLAGLGAAFRSRASRSSSHEGPTNTAGPFLRAIP